MKSNLASSNNPPHPNEPPPPYSYPQLPMPGAIQNQPKGYTNNYSAGPSAPPPGIQYDDTQAPKPTVIYANATITTAGFGPYPQRFTCPSCNAHVMTETQSTPGLLTYILSGTLCVLAGWFPCCCLIPCCVRECKDIEHRCPNCQHKLGLYKRI